MVTLGLNIDHVATLREVRKDIVPNLLKAAQEGVRGGAKGITVHLREDRRHIQDRDVFILKQAIKVPLNLEMSIAPNVVRVALHIKPEKACLVPEKRKELTTEGGLDLRHAQRQIATVVNQLKKKGVTVSLFIDPEPAQLRVASEVNADFIELHTGVYARTRGSQRKRELKRLRDAAEYAHELGLGVNAGHGLNYENVKPVAQLPCVEELNIGHAIIARAVFVGIRKAVSEMIYSMR
ncbi:MAG: pyridoxine 5'-phosphate synthase [Candidatus Omnitrophica bacterium]|nr:pyridoxine 5'-phosphate synthase [Candidatus Omnitrophota bacterium]